MVSLPWQFGQRSTLILNTRLSKRALLTRMSEYCEAREDPDVEKLRIQR